MTVLDMLSQIDDAVFDDTIELTEWEVDFVESCRKAAIQEREVSMWRQALLRRLYKKATDAE
jgi:hypothetical protein